MIQVRRLERHMSEPSHRYQKCPALIPLRILIGRKRSVPKGCRVIGETPAASYNPRED
jgi:hypothetical protein